MNLYISDLDGTLLDGSARISSVTRHILMNLMQRGMALTIATGRTPLSALHILKDVPIRLPMVLINGALLYDPLEQRCLETILFSTDCMEAIAQAESLASLHGMILLPGNKYLRLALGQVDSMLWEGYFSQEIIQDCIAVENRAIFANAMDLQNCQALYALYMDNCPDRLQIMVDRLREHDGLTLDFYQDIYTENRWCLEITSADASKYRAVQRLRELCGADWIIGFGDSWNDIPLFEACDERYAVANASDLIKTHADHIIGSNLEDGVAAFLMKRWEKDERYINC